LVGGEEALEFLADGVSREGTTAVHVRDMIAVVPSSTGKVEGGRELTFFHFIIVINVSSNKCKAFALIVTRHELVSMPR